MRGAMIQTIVGLAIGIPAAYLCVRFIEAQLYDIKGDQPHRSSPRHRSPSSLAATLAGLIPARRAASIDPANALRTE